MQQGKVAFFSEVVGSGEPAYDSCDTYIIMTSPMHRRSWFDLASKPLRCRRLHLVFLDAASDLCYFMARSDFLTF